MATPQGPGEAEKRLPGLGDPVSGTVVLWSPGAGRCVFNVQDYKTYSAVPSLSVWTPWPQESQSYCHSD